MKILNFDFSLSHFGAVAFLCLSMLLLIFSIYNLYLNVSFTMADKICAMASGDNGMWKNGKLYKCKEFECSEIEPEPRTVWVRI